MKFFHPGEGLFAEVAPRSITEDYLWLIPFATNRGWFSINGCQRILAWLLSNHGHSRALWLLRSGGGSGRFHGCDSLREVAAHRFDFILETLDFLLKFLNIACRILCERDSADEQADYCCSAKRREFSVHLSTFPSYNDSLWLAFSNGFHFKESEAVIVHKLTLGYKYVADMPV